MIDFIIEYWQSIATIGFIILSFIIGYKLGSTSKDVDNFPRWP